MSQDPHSLATSRRVMLAASAGLAFRAALHFRCPDGLGVELNPVDPARIWGLA